MRFPKVSVAAAATTLLVPLAVLTASGSARAQLTLNVNLTHGQEPEPTASAPFLTSGGAARPASFGTATFVLNAAQTQLSMSATIFNIDIDGTQTPGDTFDNLIAAHIHVYPFPPPSPLPGTAPVRWGFFGAPDNDIPPTDQLVVTPLGGGLVGGTFTSIWDLPEGNGGTTLSSNLPAILHGLSYVNFHTTQFGGGEIRGQIPAAIPEPGTLALTCGAILPLLGLVRRRRG
jgi:hypothetical protein